MSRTCTRPRSLLALSGLSRTRAGDTGTSVSLVLSPGRRSEDEGDKGRLGVPNGRVSGGGLRRSPVSNVWTAVSEEACESVSTDLRLSSFTMLKGLMNGNDWQRYQHTK